MSFLNFGIAQVIEDFTLDNLENEQVSLEELKGDQLTIIDFWATWCKPCTKAMPKLNELYNSYKDQGLNIIGISCDGPRSISKVPAVANALKVDYTILTDIDCEVMNTYQYQAFPTLVLLNADNEVVYLHEGYRNGDEEEIKKEIDSHLK
jgi:peroxiredoxin